MIGIQGFRSDIDIYRDKYTFLSFNIQRYVTFGKQTLIAKSSKLHSHSFNVKEEIVRLRTCVLTNIGEKNDTLDHNFSPE